jgi:hypothetical protein
MGQKSAKSCSLLPLWEKVARSAGRGERGVVVAIRLNRRDPSLDQISRVEKYRPGMPEKSI